MQMIELYSPVQVHDHILPIAFLLVDDRVHQVRITALRVVRLSHLNVLVCVYIHCVSKKRHLIFYHNLGKYEPIFKILSLPYSSENSLNILP